MSSKWLDTFRAIDFSEYPPAKNAENAENAPDLIFGDFGKSAREKKAEFDYPYEGGTSLRTAPVETTQSSDARSQTKNAGHSPSDPTRCAHCGEGERSGSMIVPFGTEATGHTWLHSECWRAWYTKRCAAGGPGEAR